MGRKPKTTGPTARDAGAFKSVLTRLNIEGWRALRMLAVENDTTLNALAVEAFNDLLKKHGKKQTVENPLVD
jgi:Antitoxin-like ribbon-helix-helix